MGLLGGIRKYAWTVPGIATELLPHQEEAIKKYKDGLILSHALGSGKTLTSLALANYLGRPADVLVPASLMANYQKEVEKHTIPGGSVPFNIQSLQKFTTHPEIIPSDRNRLLILDEAHRIRNSASKAYKNMEGLAQEKLLLTGTPIYNHPKDLTNLAVLLEENKKKKILIRELDHVRNRDNTFADLPYVRRDFVNAYNLMGTQKEVGELAGKLQDQFGFNRITRALAGEARNKKINTYGTYFGLRTPIKTFLSDLLPPRGVDQLLRTRNKMNSHRALATELIRQRRIDEQDINAKDLIRDAKGYLQERVHKFTGQTTDVPKRKDTIVPVTMGEQDQREYFSFYNQLPETLRKKIDKMDIKDVTPTELNNAFMTYSRMVGNKSKAKQVAKDIVNTDGKTVAYSNFLEDGLYHLGEELEKKNVPFMYYTGKERNRKEIVDAYNTGKIKALLVSSAGGEGLDLKETKNIAIMEPHWNVEKINQVIGRGIRYKSHADPNAKVQVNYYKTMLPNQRPTVDDYLRSIADHKKDVSTAWAIKTLS